MSQRRFPRPASVAVVCYILLILGGVAGVIWAIFTYSRQATSPVDPPIPISEILIGLIASVLIGLCAVFMLRGANWARILFYVGAVLASIGGVATGFPGFGVPTVVCLVIAGIVFAMPGANRFFLGRERPRSENGPPLEYHIPPEPPSRHSHKDDY